MVLGYFLGSPLDRKYYFRKISGIKIKNFIMGLFLIAEVGYFIIFKKFE